MNKLIANYNETNSFQSLAENRNCYFSTKQMNNVKAQQVQFNTNFVAFGDLVVVPH